MADQQRPNILVIVGDDIGTWNVGIYTHGMMGQTSPKDGLHIRAVSVAGKARGRRRAYRSTWCVDPPKRSSSSARIGTPRLHACTPWATHSFSTSMISSVVAPSANAAL